MDAAPHWVAIHTYTIGIMQIVTSYWSANQRYQRLQHFMANQQVNGDYRCIVTMRRSATFDGLIQIVQEIADAVSDEEEEQAMNDAAEHPSEDAAASDHDSVHTLPSPDAVQPQP